MTSRAPELLELHSVLALSDLVHGESLELAGLTDLGLEKKNKRFACQHQVWEEGWMTGRTMSQMNHLVGSYWYPVEGGEG